MSNNDNSVTHIVDGNGVMVEIAYNPWGTPSYTGNIEGLSVLWNGYYYDDETDNYYLRNRFYSPLQGLFITEDPHGIKPDDNWENGFGILKQYADGVNLQLYTNANPITYKDSWGLCDCPSGILSEWATPGRNGNWGFIRARLHFRGKSGETVEFSARSGFSSYVKETIRGTAKTELSNSLYEQAKSIAQGMPSNSCTGLGLSGDAENYRYFGNASYKWNGTIGNGDDDEFSDVSYKASCCFKKPCCVNGQTVNVKVKCKVQVTIRDLYGYHYNPDQAVKGKNFWTVIHYFDDFEEKIPTKCK